MKKKILLLGSSGMLGSALAKTLGQDHEVICPIRHDTFHSLPKKNIIIRLENDNLFLQQVIDISNRIRPDIIINCVGRIKQKSNVKYDGELLRVNAILPRLLSDYCINNKIWLIHFSTDCVFDGTNGNYSEQDLPNPQDLYGLTKLIGEDIKNNALVIRTSIIGHENNTASSLLDWFLSQKGQVHGYKNAWFSGVTTVELSKIISETINEQFGLNGLYHVSGPKINKSELLKLIAQIYDKRIAIVDCEVPVIDRSLVDDKFRHKINVAKKTWPEMLSELRKNYGK